MLAKPSVETLWRDSDAAIIEGREDRPAADDRRRGAVGSGGGSWSSSLGGIASARPRAAYGRRWGNSSGGCEARGLRLRDVSPLHVAGYIWTHPGVGYRP